MKYSQIISYYKQPEILEKTLHIWANQKFPKGDYEVLVMDGGNEQEGLTTCKDYKNKYPELNLRYFNYDGSIEYKCPVHAFNVGIKQAKGEIVGITMEDRLTTFDAVEALYRPHDKNKNIFCTVLPYLLSGNLANNPLDKIDWRSNPKLMFAAANPTIIATKEKVENETVMFSVPKNTIVKLGGFDERWRDYGYWMLNLYERFIKYGLSPHEVGWVLNVHHHHKRHGTMNAQEYDGESRYEEWKKIKSLNNNTVFSNTGLEWGKMDGDKEVEL